MIHADVMVLSSSTDSSDSEPEVLASGARAVASSGSAGKRYRHGKSQSRRGFPAASGLEVVDNASDDAASLIATRVSTAADTPAMGLATIPLDRGAEGNVAPVGVAQRATTAAMRALQPQPQGAPIPVPPRLQRAVSPIVVAPLVKSAASRLIESQPHLQPPTGRRTHLRSPPRSSSAPTGWQAAWLRAEAVKASASRDTAEASGWLAAWVSAEAATASSGHGRMVVEQQAP